MKFFMFAASLRKESLNKKMITLAGHIVTESQHTADVADFSEFDLPYCLLKSKKYNG